MKTHFTKTGIFLILLIWIGLSRTYGQTDFTTYPFDTTATYLITLNDKSEFIGHFLSKDESTATFKTNLIPSLQIPLLNIKNIKVMGETRIVNNQVWFPNPNATRYLFAPSAFNLEKGEGYYQNAYLVLNMINVGITDYFSMGGGFEFITTISSITDRHMKPIAFITPKLGFKITDKFHAGTGLILASVPEFFDNEKSGAGILYGVGTYGTMDNNATLGLGWGFIGADFTNRPFITINAMLRVSKSVSMVTENWLMPVDGYYGIISYGVRFFSRKITVDFALLNNRDIVDELILGIPYIDFVVKF